MGLLNVVDDAVALIQERKWDPVADYIKIAEM